MPETVLTFLDFANRQKKMMSIEESLISLAISPVLVILE